MNISRDEAAAALGEVDKAGERVKTVQLYAGAAPFMILWGAIWLVGNGVVDLWPQHGFTAWIVCTSAGMATSLWLTIRNSLSWERRYALSPLERRALGRRFALLGITLIAFFPATFAVVGPLGPRQGNAFASLIWAFVYMAAGAWVGWRLFAIGLVTAVAIEFGFFFIHQHYFMWMGVVGGGALIAGGLWLRKI